VTVVVVVVLVRGAVGACARGLGDGGE